MRILSLACPLPDAAVDNYDWASAPSFFDYDAMVVDPSEAVSRLIDNVLTGAGDAPQTYDDEAVLDGPTTANAVGLADLLRRRREETERLLARGGLVVCFAYPDVAHTGVSGFNGAHRMYWLPAPAGKDYSAQYVKPALGMHVETADYESPFANYMEQFRNNVQYRALFSEGANGFGGRIIGRSPGGAAIAVEVEVGGGRIVFLPAPPPRLGPVERSNLASAMVSAVRNSLLLGAEEGPPYWLDNHPVPGILEAKQRSEAAAAALENAEAEAEDARNALRGLSRWQRLIWQEGKYGLDLPVRDAFVLLGMMNFANPDEPAHFLFDGEHVYVEAQGSSDAVGMEPHYRLRSRLEEHIASSSERRRGIIVVNGYRLASPENRGQQYTDALRVAAESMRYCVVTSDKLFEAVNLHLQDKGGDEAFLKQLLATEGIYGAESEQDEAVEELIDNSSA